MKWTYIIQQKIKVALLLTSILLLIIVTNLLGRKNIADISKSFTSIYNDRLIPTKDIFYITENLYSKKASMEQLLNSNKENNIENLTLQLNKNNHNIDSLIHKFEKTQLVEKENQLLLKFKKNISQYNEIEKFIVALPVSQIKENGRTLYKDQGEAALQHSIKTLYDLIEIQSSVGEELFKNSNSIMYSTNLLSILQISLAIIIGGIIQALVLTSKMVNQRNQDFNLN